jgi:hypothetical protein
MHEPQLNQWLFQILGGSKKATLPCFLTDTNQFLKKGFKTTVTEKILTFEKGEPGARTTPWLPNSKIFKIRLIFLSMPGWRNW